MIKHMARRLCLLALCGLLLAFSCSAEAPDPARSCSLTLTYARSGQVFSGLQVDIHRVAELHSDGSYHLLRPYAGWPIRIHHVTSQQEWRDIAATIRSYAAAESTPAYETGITDAQGRLVFTGLQTGLYMVRGVTVEQDGTGYQFQDFMVYLPTPTGSGYNYHVEARPKSSEYTKPVQYSLVKLWNDSADPAARPASVEVEILLDGTVQQRVTLNRGNNWSHSWQASDSAGTWTVVERNVPAGYTVSISGTGASFVITNTLVPDDPGPPVGPDDIDPPDPPNPPDPVDPPGDPPVDPDPEVPKTGDTSPLLLYVAILCISGFGMVILALLVLKERANEKKR